MTKPIDILRKGVDHWNAWRHKNLKIKPDLKGAVLMDLDLSGANLYETNLLGANLRGACLYRANLHFANLHKANLSCANLRRANLLWANLQRANLCGADLFAVNLGAANLREANLHRVNLHEGKIGKANLDGADLTEAIIQNVVLEGANLRGANLYCANLCETDLRGADLRGADLTHAALYYTNFSHTFLQDTNFYECKLESTIFAFTNLNRCKNLETVLVRSPCAIDFDTLKNSPDIPKLFLSKIGLPDTYIEYFPDIKGEESIAFYPVFLSHSSSDKSFTSPLYDGLTKKGANVWYDEKKIKPGDFIREEIHKGVSLYDKMILVCSKESLNSWWVEQEIDRYEEKEREYWKHHGEKISLIIPISIDDEVFTSNNAVAPNLRKRNIADFRNWKVQTKYDKAFEKLLAALNVNRGGADPISYL